MGPFDQLQEDFDKQRERGCEPSPKAEKFVEDYSDRVEAEKQALKDRQAQERRERQ
ncbi:MAG: hypothetical protein AAF215_03515 [Cyanobacteria bacterium P01_A01_bin.123]